MLNKIIKLFCTALMLVISFECSVAQTLQFEWVREGAVKGTENSNFKAGARDKDGNVYVVGDIAGDVFFGSGSSVVNLNHMRGVFLAKYDRSGALLWAKLLSPSGSFGDGFGVSVDPTGAVYVTGVISGTIEFQVDGIKHAITTSGYNVFVCKTDRDGNIRWLRTIQGSTFDKVNAIAQDHEANLYIGGAFRNAVNFNPGGTGGNFSSNGSYDDGYIMKVDSSGDFQWVKVIGGNRGDAVVGLTTDAQGNIYATGEFLNTVDFSSGAGAVGATLSSGLTNSASNIFVLKLNAMGGFVWVKSMVSAVPHGASRGNSIRVDAVGNVYTTGYFAGKVDFNPGSAKLEFATSGTTARDVFVSKLSATGDFVWAQQIGAANQDEGKRITLDKNGDVYVSGIFRDAVDFDPSSGGTHNITSYNSSLDVFLLKLDPRGDFVWANRVGGDLTDDANDLFVDEDYSIYILGRYRTEAEFYFGTDSSVKLTSPSPNGSGFVQKLSQRFCTPTAGSLTITNCDSIRVNGQKYTASGTYTQTLVNTAGCDSILTLRLTVNHSIVGSNVTHTTCDSFSFNNRMHYASGSYQHVFKTTAGCDSTVMLNLTVNQSVQTILTENVCADYTIDTNTYTESGVYQHRFRTASGCDSLVTLHLTILNYADTVAADACFSYVLGADTFTTSGQYTTTFTNAAGCDSSVTIDLIIREVDISVVRSGLTLTAGQAGATYHWLNCNEGNVLIPGATSQSFSPDSNGSYAVVIEKDGCIDTSACYEITGITNSVQNINESYLRVYPNPAKDVLYIKSGNHQITAVRLLSVTGSVLRQHQDHNSSNSVLVIGDITPGVYLLEVHAGGSVIRTRFVKE